MAAVIVGLGFWSPETGKKGMYESFHSGVLVYLCFISFWIPCFMVFLLGIV
ncbi:hypothetical protein Hanom_Chr08g00726861 [Helianthus anomalus]